MQSQNYQNNSPHVESSQENNHSSSTNQQNNVKGNQSIQENHEQSSPTFYPQRQSQGTQNVEGAQGNEQISATDNIARGQINFQRPRYMYKYYFDYRAYQWRFNLNFMFPQYYKHFKGLQATLEQLAETMNKKWSQQQRLSYVTYLTDVNNYIKQYIWTKQIFDYNYFKFAMKQYSQYTNVQGAQLYDTQLDYLYKKSTGYDFIAEQKKKKQEEKKKKQQKKQLPGKKLWVEIVDKKNNEQMIKTSNQQKAKRQQQLIQLQRTADPHINLMQLKSRKFQQDKYTSIQIFRKQNANLVFIGHVDSGKSTLTGNILKQLNQVDQQQLLRVKQQSKQNHMESWQLAGIADVDPTERQKGITIEYAKLCFHYGDRRFTVFDAPGHKNYVPNMIMGACQSDIAILIVSAKIGEFQAGFVRDGQTRQHALLAKSLGVNSIIVAVTKMATVDWAQSRYNEIKEKIQPFLKGVCGYPQCKFIPIDSIANTNIHKPLELNSWYKGQFLLQALEKIALPERNVKGPLRIPIIDKFKDAGNFFIYGKLQSGVLIENQTVTLLPQRKQFVIREIYNPKDERLPYAIAGQNLKLRIKGLEQDQIKRGNMICNNLNYCLESQQFKASLTLIQVPEQKKLLSTGYQCVIHLHAISQNIEIVKIQSKRDPKDASKTIQASFLIPGDVGTVVIKIQNPICLEKYEFMPNLGRFTLRDQGKTIGYGEILKIKPAKALMKEQKQQLGLGNKKEEVVRKI